VRPRAELEGRPALAVAVRICVPHVGTGEAADGRGGYDGQIGDRERHAVFDERRDDDGDAASGDDV